MNQNLICTTLRLIAVFTTVILLSNVSNAALIAFSTTGKYFLAYQTNACIEAYGTITIFHTNFTSSVYTDPDCTSFVFTNSLNSSEWSYPSNLDSRYSHQLDLYQSSGCDGKSIGAIYFDLNECYPSLFTPDAQVLWREDIIGLHSDLWLAETCALNPDSTTLFLRDICDFSQSVGSYYQYSSKFSSSTSPLHVTGFLSILPLMAIFLTFPSQWKLFSVLVILLHGFTHHVHAEDLHTNRSSLLRVYWPAPGFNDFTTSYLSDQYATSWSVYRFTSQLQAVPFPNFCNPARNGWNLKFCHAGIRLYDSSGFSVFLNYGYPDGSPFPYQNIVVPPLLLTVTTPTFAALATIALQLNPNIIGKRGSLRIDYLKSSVPPASDYPQYKEAYLGTTVMSVGTVRETAKSYVNGLGFTYNVITTNCQDFATYFLNQVGGTTI